MTFAPRRFRSELYFAIEKKLRENNIQIPFSATGPASPLGNVRPADTVSAAQRPKRARLLRKGNDWLPLADGPAWSRSKNQHEQSDPHPGLDRRRTADLAYAKSLLENPGLAARLANLMGSPIEKGFKLLPKGWVATVQKASHAALSKALHVAVLTIDRKSRPRAANLMHKILAGASGGIGGAFGAAALPLELPISTTIMLRSIADIARSEGHELDSWDTRISCLEVFALGGRSPQDDAAENAYWIIRATLAKAVSEAAAYLAQRGVVEEGAPAIMRLIALIASRFGVVVSSKWPPKPSRWWRRRPPSSMSCLSITFKTWRAGILS